MVRFIMNSHQEKIDRDDYSNNSIFEKFDKLFMKQKLAFFYVSL